MADHKTKDGFLAPEHSEPQDWDKLAAWLKEQGHDFAPEPPPRQFAGGFGNLNYMLEIDGKQYVLRRPPAGPLPPGANDMNREHTVLKGLWREFPLAPRAILFCDDEDVLGAPFFVMEYRPGLVVHDTLPDVLTDEGKALSEMMVGVLADFHAVGPAKVGLEALGKPEGFLERAVKGWIKRAHVASEDIYEDKRPPKPAREMAQWLEAQPIPQGDVTLLHNDFKLNNIVLNPERPTEPIAVLDWDMCTRGDPFFDLGTLISYWVEEGDPEPMKALNQMPTDNPGFLKRREVVELYAQRSGRDVSDFHFHHVLGVYKLGIIFLQLYARYCRGTVRDPRYAALGELGDAIFDFGLEIVQGKRD